MRPSELKARELAEQQHAILTYDDLRACGLGPEEIATLVGTGGLDRRHRQTFRVVGAPQTPHQPIAAAVKASRGLAARWSAAFLFGLRGVEIRRPEVVVLGTSQPQLSGVHVYRTNRLDPPDCDARLGVACTSMARLLLDLAWNTTDLAYERVVSDARFQGHIGLDQMWRTLDRLGKRGRRGTARLRRYLESEAPNRPLEGELELRALRLFRAAGLPTPEVQHWVELDGVWMRLDMAYPALKIAIEVDGLVGRLTKADLQRNDQKKTLLGVAGWTTLHFTWDDITGRPEWVVRQIRAVLCRLDSDEHC